MGLIRSSAELVRRIMEAIGLPSGRVEFVDAEKLASDKDYWGLVIRVLKNASLARVKRALTIMGRRADEAEMDASKLVYPAMQVSDIFYLDLDVALGGMDQRKAHMLARDLARRLGYKKPIALHTPILTGLQGVARMEPGLERDEVYMEAKMSKSVPGTAIWVHDGPREIAEKLRKAYCPPRETRFNPVLEINKYILFQQEGFTLRVERPPKYGGPVEFSSYRELEEAYARGELHPLDLKTSTAEALSKLLEPIREALGRDKRAAEIMERLAGRVTR
jgi:tyrosyl-tRNA synthetase